MKSCQRLTTRHTMIHYFLINFLVVDWLGNFMCHHTRNIQRAGRNKYATSSEVDIWITKLVLRHEGMLGMCSKSVNIIIPHCIIIIYKNRYGSLYMSSQLSCSLAPFYTII